MNTRIAPTFRKVLRIKGKDTRSYLQGLTSQSIHKLPSCPSTSSPISLPSIFTGFLNPQGRVLFESLLYSVSGSGSGERGEEIFVEFDPVVSNLVQSHLRRYTLRSEISMELMDNISVFHAWNPQSMVISNNLNTSGNVENDWTSRLGDYGGDGIFYSPDPRLFDFGYRILVDTTHEKANSFPFQSSANDMNSSRDFTLELVDNQKYVEWRMMNGVVEGSAEFKEAFPQEFNLDLMNGVDYKKGCYVGQELVIRTHHRGVVRKRILPVSLEKPIPSSVAVKDDDFRYNISCVDASLSSKRGDGKLISSSGTYGLALVRLDCLNDQGKGEFYVDIGNEKISLTAQFPGWWPKTKIQ